MDLQRSDDGRTIHLPSDCTVENAAALKDALLDTLKRTHTSFLDISPVSHIDLAGIQVLFAALQTGNSGGGTLALAGEFPESCRVRFHLSGYDRILEAKGWYTRSGR